MNVKKCLVLLLASILTFGSPIATLAATPDQHCNDRETIRHWITASAAVLVYYRNRDFRSITTSITPEDEIEAQITLASSWNIRNGDDLRRQVSRLLQGSGHNQGFIDLLELINLVGKDNLIEYVSTDEDLINANMRNNSASNFILESAALGHIDAWIVQEVRDSTIKRMQNRITTAAYIGDKWGETGIIGWDLIRISTIIGISVDAGFIDHEEAYRLMEPSIALLQYHFSSWDEAIGNWLDGYAFWSQMDMGNPSYTFTRRHTIFESLKRFSDLYQRAIGMLESGEYDDRDEMYNFIEQFHEMEGRWYYRFPILFDDSLFDNSIFISYDGNQLIYISFLTGEEIVWEFRDPV